jgi:hypothetical protein
VIVRSCWLIPTILATWEAENERIVPGEPIHTHKKVFTRPHLTREKLDMVAQARQDSYYEKGKIGGSRSWQTWANVG